MASWLNTARCRFQVEESTWVQCSLWGGEFMRGLTEVERQAIVTLAAEFTSGKERDQLLLDISNCTVEERAPDRSLLSFNISGYERPAGHKQSSYRGKDGFPVEGSMKDADGAEMSVYLFADMNSRIYELEFDKHATDAVIKPDWSTFRIR